MIKLNTQGDTSPKLRTVLESGEQSSFMDKMSALAQKAISRLTGSSYAGGSFSRITKMIPAVMLAVFAFTGAQAQVYQHNFNNLSSTPTAPELAAPGTSATGITSSSWAGTGGTITRYAGVSGGTDYALGNTTGSTSYTFTLTLNVDPLYTLDLSSITYNVRQNNNLATDATHLVEVDGTQYGGGAQTRTNANWSGTITRTESRTNLSGAVVITVTGTRPDAFGYSPMSLDNFTVNGTLSLACTPPMTQSVTNSGALCVGSGATATITLGGTENGVTYELRNNSAPGTVVSTIVSTGTGAQNFPVTVPVGTYTVNAFNTVTTSCSTAVVGTTTVSTLTAPTVDFTVAENNGPICLGAKAEWYITGTPGATVTYSIDGNALQSIVLGTISGTATIEYTNTGVEGDVTLNLVSATLANCGNNLNPQPTSTVTVRPALAISAITAAQTICSGATFSKIGYTLTGSSFARTVYYRINGTSGTMVVPVGQTTVGVSSIYAIPVSSLATTNAGPADLVHTINIDSVVYNAGAANCVSTVGATSRTLTVRPLPTFDFYLNGNTLVTPGTNQICMPIASVTFSIGNIAQNGSGGGTYTIVKDGVTLGSGSVTSGTSSLLPMVNFNPGGTYVVTLTGANCTSTKTYTVVEVNKPSFVYTINGQTITNGSVVNVCEGDVVNYSLSGANTAAYTVTGLGATSGSLGSSATTWTATASTVNTFYGSLNVGSVPVLGGCDTTINYSIVVNPKPVVLSKVRFNTDTVINGNGYSVCENENVSIKITGTPGQFVEIWRNEGSSANFTTVGSQVGTFVIPAGGVYTYAFNAGPWASNHESPSNFRDWIRIELKNPTTLCANAIEFDFMIKQKPRVSLSYFDGPSPITATSGAAIANNDTVRVCFPANLRVFFNRGASNISGNINYVYSKDGTTAATGTIVDGQVAGADYYELPVSAGAAGWYTLAVTGANGCDSSVRFYLKPNAKPNYTYVITGTSTVPDNSSNTINFCEGYPKGITLTGTGGVTQSYTIKRTSAPGQPVEFSGSLTSTTASHIFAGLTPGNHNYTLTVTSNAGLNECVSVQTFTVSVTEMPKPVLQANGNTQVNGSTYEYCENEVVEYTLSGMPVGSAYTLSRTNGLGTFVIGTGGTVANQTSVVTVVSNATNAGVYTLKVTNNSTSTCDSIMSFTVVVNDRPDLTYINHSSMLDCYGASNGWVNYSYSGSATTFKTFIVDLGGNDTVQTHTSNLQSQVSVTHSNLIAGDYKLILTTDKGCDTSFLFSIGQPTSPVTVSISGTQAACNTSNGTVTFDVAGGTPGYSVVVTNNVTNVIATTFTQPSPFSNYTVSNLSVGTYTVTVTDSKGCVGTASFTINNCSTPDLVPVANFPSSNYSIANTTALPLNIELYNVGQLASTGSISVAILLPPNFTISSTGLSAGWTISTSGIYTVLTSTTAVVAANASAATVINANVVLTGTTSTGINAILVQIVPNSGGDVNTVNNTSNAILNIVN